MFDYIYFDMSLILSPRELVMQELASPDFMSRVLTYQQLPFSAVVLCWVTIFVLPALLPPDRSAENRFDLLDGDRGDRRRFGYFFVFVTSLSPVRISAFPRVSTSVFYAILNLPCANRSCPVECARGSGFMRTIVISQVANALNMLADLLIS